MAEDQPPDEGGSPKGGAAAQKAPFVRRATARGLAPAPHLGGSGSDAPSAMPMLETPPEIPLTLPAAASETPAPVHVARVISINPPPPEGAAPSHARASSSAPPPGARGSVSSHPPPATARGIAAAAPARRASSSSPPPDAPEAPATPPEIAPRSSSSSDAEVPRVTASMIRVPPAPLLPTSTAQDVDADSAPPPRGTWSTPPPGASSPPFAPIRSLPAPLDPRLILLTEPSSARADSFRSLRDNLVANKLPRVLAVTSAAHREGKTTCAVNLALALSEQPAAKILFIDANAFDTAAARMFAIDVSTRPAPSMDAPFLMPYRVADVTRAFHVAALVRHRGEPPPRFDAQWFDALVGHLCSASYDHIVIDLPALEGTPATSQLAAVADAALLTVRSGVTTARALRRAQSDLTRTKLLGVTLMDAPTT